MYGTAGRVGGFFKALRNSWVWRGTAASRIEAGTHIRVDVLEPSAGILCRCVSVIAANAVGTTDVIQISI